MSKFHLLVNQIVQVEDKCKRNQRVLVFPILSLRVLEHHRGLTEKSTCEPGHSILLRKTFSLPFDLFCIMHPFLAGAIHLQGQITHQGMGFCASFSLP